MIELVQVLCDGVLRVFILEHELQGNLSLGDQLALVLLEWIILRGVFFCFSLCLPKVVDVCLGLCIVLFFQLVGSTHPQTERSRLRVR